MILKTVLFYTLIISSIVKNYNGDHYTRTELDDYLLFESDDINSFNNECEDTILYNIYQKTLDSAESGIKDSFMNMSYAYRKLLSLNILNTINDQKKTMYWALQDVIDGDGKINDTKMMVIKRLIISNGVPKATNPNGISRLETLDICITTLDSLWNSSLDLEKRLKKKLNYNDNDDYSSMLYHHTYLLLLLTEIIELWTLCNEKPPPTLSVDFFRDYNEFTKNVEANWNNLKNNSWDRLLNKIQDDLNLINHNQSLLWGRGPEIIENTISSEEEVDFDEIYNEILKHTEPSPKNRRDLIKVDELLLWGKGPTITEKEEDFAEICAKLLNSAEPSKEECIETTIIAEKIGNLEKKVDSVEIHAELPTSAEPSTEEYIETTIIAEKSGNLEKKVDSVEIHAELPTSAEPSTEEYIETTIIAEKSGNLEKKVDSVEIHAELSTSAGPSTEEYIVNNTEGHPHRPQCSTKSTNPGQIIHSDVCGPIEENPLEERLITIDTNGNYTIRKSMFGYFPIRKPEDSKIRSLIENDNDMKLLLDIYLWLITIKKNAWIMFESSLDNINYYARFFYGTKLKLYKWMESKLKKNMEFMQE